MPAPDDVAVILPAAGASRRMGGRGSKLFAELAGEPVIRHTMRVFQSMAGVGRIVVVCRAEERQRMQDCFTDRAAWDKLGAWVEGGAERQDSVYRGLQALAADPPRWVLVHDAARPFCSAALVRRLVDALEGHPAVVPVLPISDTVRRITEGGHEVVQRGTLLRTQTPQAFHWKVIHAAYEAGMARDTAFTDDAQLVEAAGGVVTTVPGEPRNIKLTEADDLAFGAWLLHNPQWGRAASS